MMNRDAGFTLLELLVVIVVIGISMAIAVPSYQNMSARNQIAYQTNDFLLAINMARSEAMRRGSPVTIQAADGSDAADEFGAGYCVQVGIPGASGFSSSCSFDSGKCPGSTGCILREFEALTGQGTLDSAEDETAITFGSLGNINGGAIQNVDLCVPGQDGRRIRIDLSGRSRSHRPDDPDSAKQPSC